MQIWSARGVDKLIACFGTVDFGNMLYDKSTVAEVIGKISEAIDKRQSVCRESGIHSRLRHARTCETSFRVTAP